MSEPDLKQSTETVVAKQFTTFERLSLALSFSRSCKLPKADTIWHNAPYSLKTRLGHKVVAATLTELLAKDAARDVGIALRGVRELVAEQEKESLVDLDKNLIVKLESQKLDPDSATNYVYETMCRQIGHSLPELKSRVESMKDAVKRKLAEMTSPPVDQSSLAYRATLAEELRVMANHSILVKVLSRHDLPIAPEHAIQAAETCTRWAVSTEKNFVMYWRLALIHAIFTEDLRVLEQHSLSLRDVKKWFLKLKCTPKKYLQVSSNQRLLLSEADDKEIVTIVANRLAQKRLNPTQLEYQKLIRKSRNGSEASQNGESDSKKKTNEELRAIAVEELDRLLARTDLA